MAACLLPGREGLPPRRAPYLSRARAQRLSTRDGACTAFTGYGCFHASLRHPEFCCPSGHKDAMEADRTRLSALTEPVQAGLEAPHPPVALRRQPWTLPTRCRLRVVGHSRHIVADGSRDLCADRPTRLCLLTLSPQAHDARHGAGPTRAPRCPRVPDFLYRRAEGQDRARGRRLVVAGLVSHELPT